MYKIPNDNPSLRIQPLWKSGAPARNALVKVDGKVKSVDGGSGYLNQMEPWAHFGNISAPVNVTVMFPDGRQKSKKLQNQRVTIEHPER